MAAGLAQPVREYGNSKLLVLRSRIAPCLTYGMELWCPARNGANMTAVLTRAAKLISGIHREASHTAVFKDPSVSQDVMLADLEVDVLSTDDHCRIAHTRQYARWAAPTAAAALHARNDTFSPKFDIAFPAAYAPDYMGAALLGGLHTWHRYMCTCHETALSHYFRRSCTDTRIARHGV